MSYRGDSPSAREKQLEKRLRHLSKNLEQAEKTIQELRRSLKVSQIEKFKFQKFYKRIKIRYPNLSQRQPNQYSRIIINF